jgi:hypothetical protein
MAALTIPPGYDVRLRRSGWVAICLDLGVIDDEIGCEAAAIHICQEHADAIADEEREAAENAAEHAVTDQKVAA